MRELHELREKLEDALKDYNRKEMTPGNLEVIDTLTHTIKNLDKIIDADEGYSNAYPEYSRMRRDSRGRYSNENYSYHGDMVSELKELMNDSPNDRVKQEFKHFIQRIESNM